MLARQGWWEAGPWLLALGVACVCVYMHVHHVPVYMTTQEPLMSILEPMTLQVSNDRELLSLSQPVLQDNLSDTPAL